MDKTSAAEVRSILERGMKSLKAFQDADKALGLLENLEQVTRESAAAVESAKAELAGVLGQVADAKKELQTAKAKAKELVDGAAARAEKHETDAKAYAQKVTQEADDRAAKVREETDALVAECLEKQAELKDLEKKAEVAMAVIAKADKIKAAMQ